MLKDKLFELVCNSDTLKNTEWIIKAFSLFQEPTDDWKKDPYPYRIVLQPNGWHFVDPETGNLSIIEDAELGKPIYKVLDPYTVKAGSMVNADKDYETTYGNAFINTVCLTMWFKKAIPFMSGPISSKRLSDAVLELLEDDVEEHEREENHIYVSDYLKFCDAVFNLVAYTQVFTPAATSVSMQSPPGIKELRDLIVAENKDRLHDPAVIANIVKQLQEYDYEYLRGDPSLGFLLKDKSLKIVRTKLFLAYGAETGLEEKVDVTFIEKSLNEGWDIDKFPEMNNVQRAGSYNRGKETERGGAKVKEIYRVAGNLKIAEKDCGSVLGVDFESKPGTEKQLIGFTVIESDGTQNKITKSTVSGYMGRIVKLRSPMYCKSIETDYCEACCGDRLSTNPNGLAMEFTAYGSKFMGMYMQAAHAKALTVRELDFDRLLN